jgi:hypothetical protein
MSRKLAHSEQIPPIWPDPEGKVQGSAIEPLYPSVPGAARLDPELYDMLALVDALRIGRTRERVMAIQEIDERLNRHAIA